MKNLFLAFVILFSLNSLASISVISDLDDTIKITEAGGHATDIIGDDVYTGMPEFFMGAKAYSQSLYILSASPKFMKSLIQRTLKKRQVEYKELILRAHISEEKFGYKVREIKKILNANSDNFILIGDDLGKDSEVYSHIKKLFPDRILGVYIHVVNGRTLTEYVQPYWTSFDLSLRELIAGRMSSAGLELTLNKLLDEKSLEFIFPKKAQCPAKGVIWEWQLATVYQPEAFRLINRFTKFCQQRQSDNILL